jgi:hypothetical protein
MIIEHGMGKDEEPEELIRIFVISSAIYGEN